MEEYPERDSVSAPTGLMQSENLVVFMLSPQTIFKIEHILKGETLNSNGKWEEYGEPKLNAKGINEIKGVLSAHLDSNIFLSIFNEERILQICKDLEFELNDNLCDYKNWIKWDLKPEDVPIIERMIMVQVEASLNRALRYGKDQGAYGMTVQAIAQQHQSREVIERKKQGTFSLFRKSKGEQ